MSTVREVPANAKVRQYLEGLIGRDVNVEEKKGAPDPGLDKCTLGVYCGPEGEIGAVCRTDLELPHMPAARSR